MELWLIGCILFVSLPMFEYGIILAAKKVKQNSSIKSKEKHSNEKSWMASEKNEQKEVEDFSQFSFFVDKVCFCLSIVFFVTFTIIYWIAYA